MLNSNKKYICNRYGDTQSFELIDNYVLWRGCKDMQRINVNEAGTITMVDPPGGPYLSTDSRLGWLYDDRGGECFEHLVIDHFVPHPEGFMIMVRNEPV